MAEPRRDNIRTHRVRRGVKRPAFAKKVGISYKHLWGIEEGHHTAAEETLQRIADALDVHIDEVMVRSGGGA